MQGTPCKPLRVRAGNRSSSRAETANKKRPRTCALSLTCAMNACPVASESLSKICRTSCAHTQINDNCHKLSHNCYLTYNHTLNVTVDVKELTPNLALGVKPATSSNHTGPTHGTPPNKSLPIAVRTTFRAAC